ncbi:hypothetical protein DPMN_161918 [Dreissena polymorpha]|uniref:Uncharacterized protein n=1 Tax=Dreissena polymorpha TaxID=45954 RepID=A0A9D4EQM1_DREPO|nr:hypothetical protein DPMN_161918 [Dreissena polymorpha]
MQPMKHFKDVRGNFGWARPMLWVIDRVVIRDVHDTDTSSYDDIDQVIGGSDDSDSDDEDDNTDRPSLPPNESHSHNVNSAGFHELERTETEVEELITHYALMIGIVLFSLS